MHGKLARTAARVAAAGAITAAGLGCAQVAQAAPAVVHVPCSARTLAADIASASSGEELSLAPSCVYRLTAGLPVVSQDLTILGNRATLERSYAPATPAFTILQADAGALTVSKLNFRHGNGAIAVTGAATLTVNGGTFAGNTAADGGAILDNSTGGNGPQVNGATFTANTATGAGGAIANIPIANNRPGENGGVQVTDSTFTANRGRAIFDNDAPAQPGVRVTDSTFTANTGGAISDSSVSEVVTGSVFSGNTAEYGGALAFNPDGGATLSRVVIHGNKATADGGGISIFNGSLFVENSSISGNHAGGRGGGLCTCSTQGGEDKVADTDIRGNSAGDGGGIYNTTQGMDLTNVKISGNYAGAYGGGIYNLGSVGAVNTRIIRNRAATGGGGIYDSTSAAAAFLTNSPVLYNKPDNCEPAGSITGCTG